LWSAVLTVIVFIGLFLGWRAAFVVGLAIPICYGMTLGLDLVVGYTINRVTLFALILALGLLVDDPITGVDNIERFLRQAGPDANLRQRVIAAIAQVRVPLVMATVAIVLAFAPLAFITGMMGPYMAPMAFNVPVAVIASTIVSFLITPWIAYKLLPGHVAPEPTDFTATPLYRGYSRIMRPLIASRGRARWFLTGVLVLFVITALLPLLRVVPLKLLPFDNKDEFQVVIDMPEASSLERTQAVAQAVAERLRQIPEVTAVAGFVGLASPMDFNGLVRHYYLRSGPQVADLRVTLAPRVHRRQQTQEIAARIRASLADVGRDHGALVKLVLSPPGPPVIATIVAELYGAEATPYERIQQAAARVADRLRQEEFIVDVDTSVESDRPMFRFVTDQDKAALSGIAVDDVARTVQLATQGLVAGYLQLPAEANPLPIKLQLPLARRNDPAELAALQLKGRPGFARIRDRNGVRDAPLPLVPLGELGEFRELTEDTTIYHKDLRRVVYVFAEPAGRPPADAILDVAADLGIAASAGAPRPIASRTHLDPGAGISWSLPADVSVVWDGEGEWDITLRVFRDMGIAFVVALVGIFIVLQLQTGSLALSLIIMSAIPLTVIGIMPGFWLLNGIGDRAIAGIPNPVLFTATAMIGMIALAGIVVRNSVILVEFIEEALQRGRPLTDALTEAGAVRMRPVLLTAGTTLLGNIVITLDPIFSGLAWAIIFGITASTAFTLLVVPVSYYLVFGGNSERHT
jgi:multidrug efflux pump subunit AcrB